MNDITIAGASSELFAEIKDILLAARSKAYRAIGSAMVDAYWEIGKRIVEDEQLGEKRAQYGKASLEGLSRLLTKEFGKGFDARNLRNMRSFYLKFPIRNAVRTELTWTHYRALLRVESDEARNWYMEEAIRCQWSSRQLDRQISTLYYERLLMSRDKAIVKQEADDKIKEVSPEGIIKDPYVLEFLGLKEHPALREKELEQALIDYLQLFLLELGRGFSFVARQKHIDLDGEHFYIDLVFYNYILKCFVLIDLKTGKLTHQDIGQMDTYVRIYDELQRGNDDNPTIGIILCSEKNEAVAHYSILNDSQQLFASKYQFTLPTVQELQDYIARERSRLEEMQDNL